jgi:tetratricopeptide (TPR) repeat protein
MSAGTLLRKIFLDRNDAQSHLELGVCYKERCDYTKALKYIRRSIELAPNDEAILQLGRCHELCDEHDLAQMIYQKLMDNSKLRPLEAALRQGVR